MAFSLVVLPNRAPSQVMNPTIPSRLAVRRLRLCSNHREEQVLGRLATPTTTSLPSLLHRNWMKDEIWKCWLHRLFIQKRQASAAPSTIFHSNRENSVSSSSHIPSSTRKLVAMDSHKRKSSRDPKTLTGVLFQERGDLRRASGR